MLNSATVAAKANTSSIRSCLRNGLTGKVRDQLDLLVSLNGRTAGNHPGMPALRSPSLKYGLNASVLKVDATPTRSKRRPPVAALGREA